MIHISAKTATALTSIAVVGIFASGCAGTTSGSTAKPATAVSSATPATPTFTDPNGQQCPPNQETSAGFCPGDDPSPAAPPSSSLPFGMSIGEPVKMTNSDNGAAWNVTLNSVHHFHQGQYEDAAHAGTHYIVINVTYDVTTGPVDINEWDWTSKSPDGTVSEVQYASSPNEISATTVQSGSKTRGTVVLAIADGQGGTIVYSAGGSEQASWKFTAAQAAS